MKVQLISSELFEAVADSAARSPRRRMNHNFHASALDNPHRFLNVLLRGTYIQPHRHREPPKSETFLVLEGIAEVVLFDDSGAVTARYPLGTGGVWGIDLPAGVWHTIVARTERVVSFEVKPGPWEAANDKEFASWAPAEDEDGAAEYCRALAAD